MDFDASIEACDKVSEYDESIDITSLSPQLLYACAYSDSVYVHIRNAVEYYMDHVPAEAFDYERFDYFLEAIDCGKPIEYAFEDSSEYLTDSDIDDLIDELNTNLHYLDSPYDDPNEIFLDEMAYKRGEYDI